MSDDYLEKLNTLLSELGKEYRIVRKKANRPEWPKLMVTKRAGRTEFILVTYENGRRIRRYINSDIERVYRLAHKAYIKEYARRLRADREILARAAKAMLPLDPVSILRALPAHYDLLDPELVREPARSAEGFSYPVPSRDAFPKEVRLELVGMDPWDWAAEPYCENTDHAESKTHVTRRGLYCRSKSEMLIFEIYMHLGIPFHYDETITIGTQRLSPDFIGVRRDGRFVFHEHCGLSSESYRARNDWKSGLYASAGIFPGDNLLYTYDDPSGSINTGLIEALIRDAYRL